MVGSAMAGHEWLVVTGWSQSAVEGVQHKSRASLKGNAARSQMALQAYDL